MLDRETKKVLGIVIAAQCVGLLGLLSFQNGVLFSYLSKIRFRPSSIVYLLAVPMTVRMLGIVPFAVLSDRYGKKRIGATGMFLTFCGFTLIFAGAVLNNRGLAGMTVIGAIVFGIGMAIYSSSWIALLSPIVPGEIRGRFFGLLRLSWQTVSLIFSFIVVKMISRNDAVHVYAFVLFVITAGLFIRFLLYLKIPERESSSGRGVSLMSSFGHVLRTPGYVPFGAYIFLLTFFAYSCPVVFNLLEKYHLGFSGPQIVLMGNMYVAGTIIGFLVGGRMVDRFGTKSVFMICHFSYSLVLLLIVLRAFIPVEPILIIGFLTICFGIVLASSSIAMTTELMAIVPKQNKSLAISINLSLLSAGSGISAFLIGKVIDLKILSPTWYLFGQRMSSYDGILLFNGVMLLLLVITLGLIPSVISKKEPLPIGS